LPAPLLAEVDAALLQGEALRHLAARIVTPSGTPLGRMSLFRHLHGCIPDQLRQAKAEDDVTRVLDVVQQLKEVNGATLRILQEARQTGEHLLALQAVDRIHKQLDLQLRLGEAVQAAQLMARLIGVEERLARYRPMPSRGAPLLPGRSTRMDTPALNGTNGSTNGKAGAGWSG
jgi:AraC-like DNA-binding protein